MKYIVDHEGPLALFKGIGPQITKGLLVQGFLMMLKERIDLLFMFLFAYMRRVRETKFKKAAELAVSKADTALTKAKTALPVTMK